jgi:hypothetical protein
VRSTYSAPLPWSDPGGINTAHLAQIEFASAFRSRRLRSSLEYWLQRADELADDLRLRSPRRSGIWRQGEEFGLGQPNIQCLFVHSRL